MPSRNGSVEELRLCQPQGETTVLAGAGALPAARPRLEPWLDGRTVFVVTTPHVWQLHGAGLEPFLSRAARTVVLEVAEGEAAKTLEVAGDLWQRLLAEGGKRDSRLVTFGGGSVGDLGGFVAGCFLRGIEYAQLPTTLLAQVDAALGGKTAVDLPGAKNSVGLFHHPKLVIEDADWLVTLPRAEIRAALAEVVKMAALLDLELLVRVERDLAALLAGEPEPLGPVVVAAARAKLGVVERDPDEQDERRLLNFGHTLAHALEAQLGYQGLRHGDAVAYGMLFALRLAVERGLDADFAARLRALLRRFELPQLVTPETRERLRPADLLVAMARDKKARESGLVWVLPAASGRGEMVSGIDQDTVDLHLQAFLADPLGA